MVETDLADGDALRRDAEQRGDPALEADRDVAEAAGAVAVVEQRAGDDADRVREVDDPRVRGGALAHALGDLEHTGTVRIAFAKPPAPVVSWPTQPQASGIVSSWWRAAWPPTRICTSTKSAPSMAESRWPVMSSAPS